MKASFTRTSSLPLRWLITLAVMGVLVWRKSDSFLNPQFWAEDGALFFVVAETQTGRAIFAPYEGYLHVIPRLIAELGTFLPLVSVPVFYASVALVLTGLVAWRLQSPRIALPGGAVAALALALLPHNGEVYLTISNLQWITAVALFALTITEDPKTRPEFASDLVTLLLAGLTGPFILLSVPLFAWRALRRRTTPSTVFLLTALACAAAHLPSLLQRPPATITEPWAPFHFAAIAGRRVIAMLFAGHVPIGEYVARALTFIVVGTLSVVLWRRRRDLAAGAMLLVALVAVLVATAYKARLDTWKLEELYNADRYFFISKILLIWLLAAVAATSGRVTRGALALLFLAGLVSNSSRLIYPPNPDQLWRTYARQIERGKPTTVPILPTGFAFTHPGRPR